VNKVWIDSSYGWSTTEHRGVEIHSNRGTALAKRLAELFSSGASVDALEHELHRAKEVFGGILVHGDRVLAFCDSTHSFPVYYVDGAGDRHVGNSARQIAAAAAITDFDREALTEFLMAGYVTGAGTVYAHLKQLQAGEMLIMEGDQASILHQYYRYLPNPGPDGDEDKYFEILSDTMNEVFGKIADRYRDAPIRVPLSGGLDSRVVLCKLKEMGCKNLEAFSYGPPNNYDARIAKRVASKLGVPWRFIPFRRAGQRALFDSDLRRQYWRYADQLSVSPSMREWEAMVVLERENLLTSDTILINGQSGDFLSGGHIQKAIWGSTEVGLSDLFTAIFDKHFALWENLMTSNQRQKIEIRIRASLGTIEDKPTKERIIALYEQWECHERQLKFVVNGQRLYEFFGCHNWQLPLWDRSLMDFWSTVPLSLKRDQKLYKRYLSQWDFSGIFSRPTQTVWRWPVHMMWVIPLARVVGLVNQDLKKEIYRYMWIFGHYSNYYAMYPFREVVRTRRNARGMISLFVETWARENGFQDHLPKEFSEPMTGPKPEI